MIERRGAAEKHTVRAITRATRELAIRVRKSGTALAKYKYLP